MDLLLAGLSSFLSFLGSCGCAWSSWWVSIHSAILRHRSILGYLLFSSPWDCSFSRAKIVRKVAAAAAAKSLQLCPTLCDPIDGSPPGSPPSLGFSRQEHWRGLPFPSPMHESEGTQSCPTFSDPMDCSLPGSSIHGIFQTRVLGWGD